MPIDLQALTEKDKGRKVVYRAAGDPTHRPDEGIITSWNEQFIFVRYGKMFTSRATYPDTLEWVVSEPPAASTDERVDF